LTVSYLRPDSPVILAPVLSHSFTTIIVLIITGGNGSWIKWNKTVKLAYSLIDGNAVMQPIAATVLNWINAFVYKL